MAEFSENRHISNLINMSCKVNQINLLVERARRELNARDRLYLTIQSLESVSARS